MVELDDVIFNDREDAVIGRWIDISDSREITKCGEYRELIAY
jgi:hypothetical protein